LRVVKPSVTRVILIEDWDDACTFVLDSIDGDDDDDIDGVNISAIHLFERLGI
jgi:hypothetical protein